jgi:hypothetical protein
MENQQTNDITFIYYLHKGNNIPFYVGKSNNPKRQRLHRHKKKFGENIFIEVLDNVVSSEWKFWERYWISQFKQWGFILENKNNGGNGISGFELLGKIHKDETKEKMRLAKIGKPSNRKGQPCSEIHKLRLSESMKQKEASPLKGISYHNEESKEKIGLIHKDKTISKEQKQKISKTQKGKTLSEAHKKAISEGCKKKKGIKYKK